MIEEGEECPFNLLGQQFRQIPDEMTQAIDLVRSRNRLQQVGFIELEDAYRTSLKETQIVLSTSGQEF